MSFFYFLITEADNKVSLDGSPVDQAHQALHITKNIKLQLNLIYTLPAVYLIPAWPREVEHQRSSCASTSPGTHGFCSGQGSRRGQGHCGCDLCSSSVLSKMSANSLGCSEAAEPHVCWGCSSPRAVACGVINSRLH